jgi:hypothetical protein
MVRTAGSTYEVMTSASIPDQPQAESLTLNLNGRSLLVGSEGKRSKVYSMPVRRDKKRRRYPGPPVLKHKAAEQI